MGPAGVFGIIVGNIPRFLNWGVLESMPLFLWDWTIFLLIPALLLTIVAQVRVTSTFNRYKEVPSARGLTGAQGARMLLDSSGLGHVGIQVEGGRLSDHYDPRSKTLTLSPEVANGNSLAALGVAAHEAGHAIQDAEKYAFLRARSSMVQGAALGSNVGFFLFFVGLVLGRNTLLMNIGIVMFSLFVLFTLVTLPVEINASRRALAGLASHNILLPDEMRGARAVLSAAALTYVAAALMALLNLLRLVLISRR